MHRHTPNDTPEAPEQVQGQDGGSMYSRDAAQARYSESSRKNRRGRTLRKALAIGIPALIVLVIVVGVASAAGFISSIGSRMNAGVTDETRAMLASQQADAKARAASALTEENADLPANWEDTTPFYMLLLGVDKSENRTQGDEAELYGDDDSCFRSDTIILARIDPGNKQVTLVSIHRDTELEIDGRSMKINAAYALGGVPKVIEVVSQFAGVPISHYAEVDIDGLAAITDAMGGVTVDVPYEINDEEYTGHLDAGMQTLNGQQALIFTRSRHAYDDLGDGDRYRAANQRLYLSAMAGQLLSSSPTTIVATINTLANYVTTDLTIDQIASLALTMKGMDTTTDIWTTMNPTTSTYTNSTWYELPDYDRWYQIMAAVDAGEKPPVDDAYADPNNDVNSANPVSTNETSADAATDSTASANATSASVTVRGVETSPMSSSDVASALASAGFTNVTLGDQATGLTEGDSVYVVYNDANQAEAAQAVANAIGGTAKVVNGKGNWNVPGDVLVVVGIQD